MSEDQEIYINRCAVGCTVMDCVKCCYGCSGCILLNTAIAVSIRIVNFPFFILAIVLLIFGNIILAITYFLSFCCRFCASELSCGDYWCCCRFDAQEDD